MRDGAEGRLDRLSPTTPARSTGMIADVELSGLPNDHVKQSRLLESIDAVLRSGLPGERPAPRWAVDAILGATSDEVRPLELTARATYATALANCQLQSGNAMRSAGLADREAMGLLQRVAGLVPATTQASCYSMLSKSFLMTGRVRDAADCARIARGYALQSGDRASVLRTMGMLAACRALNGEFVDASHLLKSAGQMTVESRSGVEKWPMVFAEILVAHRAGDPARIEAALANLDDANSEDVLERLVAQAGLIWLHAVRNEFREVVTVAERLTHGVDRSVCPPLLLEHVFAMEGLALIQLGDPSGAQRVIEGRQSLPGHSVCFELVRATIHLILQEPQKALRVTEACVSSCPDHVLRTLPSVQLRRAIAFEMRGLQDVADAEFSRASHLAAEIGAVSPVVGLHMDLVEALYWRLMANEPAFGKIISARLPGNGQYPEPRPLTFTPPKLTDRELVLAGWLTTDLTMVQIAERMVVSINTIKTQARSLYKKLHVKSRAQAVLTFERIAPSLLSQS